MVNRVTLLGNLGADPEMKATKSGMAVANLRLATKDREKDGDTWKDVTEWHRIVCFGKVAENVGRFCQKGKTLYVEGKIKTRKWQDKEGNDRYSTEIVADNIRFIGGSGGGEERRSAEPSTDRGVPDDGIPF